MRMIGKVAAAAALVLGAAMLPGAAQAQSGGGMRVIVMGEDSNPDTVIRDSDIFKRVIAALKDQMGREDFRMVDEEMLAVDLGWRIRTRREKTELIETAKLANTSGNATHRARALTLFRIHAIRENLDYATKLKIRVAGETYDLLTNQFLGQYELPLKTFSAPAECNRLCVSETVGAHARDIAADIAYVLAQQLRYLTGGGDGGMATTYTITLKNFAAPDAVAFEQVMSEEFPDYVRHEVIERTPTRVGIDYVSRSSAAKLNEWMTILLMDMGIRPGREAIIMVDGAQITVDRIVGASPVSRGGSSRFK